MSNNKRPSNADSAYYENHLFGRDGRFSRNSNADRQKRIERMYLRILTELATNRFRWTGLPESIDVRFMELQLFYRALAVFYWDNRFNKFFALQGSPAGAINMYNNPTHFLVTGSNFHHKTLTDKECVPVWANYLRMPDLDIVQIYASKLANIDITIEINMRNARRSRVAVVDENTQMSVDNIIKQIDDGNPLIKVTQSIGGMAAALDLGVDPKSIETLSIVRTRLWSECMGMLGIDNANQDKKERLISGEVEANQDQVSSMKFVNLNARRASAHAIKEMFDIDIWVDYATDADEGAQIPSIDYLGELTEVENDSEQKEIEASDA